MTKQRVFPSWAWVSHSLVGFGVIIGLPLTAARADTLVGFDDVPVNRIEVGVNSGYRFNGFRTQNGSMGGGWRSGIVSPQLAAFASFGRQVTITSFDPRDPFTFNSGYFTAASSAVAVTVQGLRDGLFTRLDQFTVTSDAPTYRLFDWTNVDTIRISGRTSDGRSPIIIYDNFLFGAALTPAPPPPVPDPSTWALMLIGMGAIGAAARKHKQAKALPA